MERDMRKKQVSQFSRFYVLKIHLRIKVCKYRFFRPRLHRGILRHPKDQLALPDFLTSSSKNILNDSSEVA